MNTIDQSPVPNKEVPASNPWAWFEDLTKTYPGAESFRPRVEQFRRELGDAFKLADDEVKRAHQHADDKLKLAQEIEADADKRLQERFRHYMVELATSAFDKQATYTTTILSIGYVGLFTAWNLTAASIPTSASRFVVVTALASLIVFILFEVFKMIYGQIFLMQTIKVAATQNSEFDAENQKYLDAQRKAQPWFYATWIISVLLSLGLGLASAGVLVYAHLEKLFFPSLT